VLQCSVLAGYVGGLNSFICCWLVSVLYLYNAMLCNVRSHIGIGDDNCIAKTHAYTHNVSLAFQESLDLRALRFGDSFCEVVQ